MKSLRNFVNESVKMRLDGWTHRSLSGKTVSSYDAGGEYQIDFVKRDQQWFYEGRSFKTKMLDGRVPQKFAHAFDIADEDKMNDFLHTILSEL